jgi:hypothetical protein
MTKEQHIDALQLRQKAAFIRTVEIDIKATNNSVFNFPKSVPELEGVDIIGISIRLQNADGTAKAVSGQSLLNKTTENAAFITLSGCKGFYCKNTPINVFSVVGKNMVYIPCDVPKFQSTNSNIQLAELYSGTTTQVVEITFFCISS